MNCQGLVLKGTNPRVCASCCEKGLAGIAVLSCRRADGTMEQAPIRAEVDVLEEAQQYLQLIRDNFLDVKRRVQASGSDDHVSEGSLR
jgi:hypothetical protein